MLVNDVSSFLKQNAACQCMVVSLNINNQGHHKVF
jgi:hypothetical protein